MDGKTKELLRKKYEGMSKLINSEEWVLWVDFLKGRKNHFQDVINASVNDGNLEQAKIAKALMDDSMEQIKLFTGQLKSLDQQIRGNNDKDSTGR